ncbi:hypothetical protein V8E36_001627 [Tilletia maclaganii]
MMHDTRLPRARRLVDAFFVIFYYMSLTACLSRLGLCLTVLKCTSFAFSVGSCGVTKQFRSSKVPLKQQGRFPAHNASSTLDYFDLERHMVMLSAKYAFRNDMSTRNSFGPERRNKGYNELQFEPEGMTWKAELFIGGADVTVEIDTTSSDCLIEASAYSPDSSVTAEAVEEFFGTVLPSGLEVTGSIWTDNIEIAGLEIPKVHFGLSHAPFMPASRHADGICGLAWPLRTAIEANGLFFEMVDLEMLDREVFGLALSRNGYSELALGAVNPELYEDLSFTPLTGDQGFWQIRGTIIGEHHTMDFDFILDSTTRYIVFPIAVAASIFRLLKIRTKQLLNGDLIGIFRCAEPPAVKIQFGVRIITLSPSDVYAGHFDRFTDECIVAIIGHGSKIREAIAGQPLFLSTYVAFDADNREVGIGPRTGSPYVS